MKFDKAFMLVFAICSFSLVGYGIYTDFTSAAHPSYLRLFLSSTASILGLVYVMLESRARPLMFVVTLVSSCFTIVYQILYTPLVWDMLLTVFYFFLAAYGLYHWKGLKNGVLARSLLKTRWLSNKERLCYLVALVVLITALYHIGLLVSKYHSKEQALLDASITIISIFGQYFISRKVMEAWFMWIGANLVGMPLYFSLSSLSYTALYMCYFAISFYGLYSWYRGMRADEAGCRKEGY